MDGENATNAKGETSLLEKLEADRKRKITPIKIKKLAMKKQKLEKKEKPKTPRKKKEKKVESMDLSSSAQPELVNPSPPTSSSTEVVAHIENSNGSVNKTEAILDKTRTKAKAIGKSCKEKYVSPLLCLPPFVGKHLSLLDKQTSL